MQRRNGIAGAAHGLATMAIVSTGVFACTPKSRPWAEQDELTAAETTPDANGGRPSSEGTAMPPTVDETASSEADEGSVGGAGLVDDMIGTSTDVPCANDAGTCRPAADAGGSVEVVCVPTGPRDCGSSLDNDCDGQPDNLVDEVCVCPLGAIETCEEHTGFDGVAACRPGTRRCIASEGSGSSNWSACEGAVAPGPTDSCAVDGDDTNCNGIPNEGCVCVEGVPQPCGSTTDVGVCAFGTSTCVNGAFGECVGAVPPAARDSCVPGDDANCNGIPNEGCTCLDGRTQPCGPPTVGVCRSGIQTCTNGTFGACLGAVGPTPRNCASPADNDCDGRPDNTIDNVCRCVIGTTQACDTHPQDGIGSCRPGQQSCVAGPGNSTSTFGNCSGAVGPAQADLCALGNDGTCNGRANEGCDCIIGQGNGPCSDDPNNSRCNDQGQCVPCQTDGDCSLVSGGRSTCDAGECVAPAPPLDCDAEGAPPQAPLPPFTVSDDPAPAPSGGTIEDGVYVTTQVRNFRVDNVASVRGETIEFRGGTFSRNSTTYSASSGDALAGAFTAGTFVTTGTSLAVEGVACTIAGRPVTPEIWGYSASGMRLELHRAQGQAGVVVSIFTRQ